MAEGRPRIDAPRLTGGPGSPEVWAADEQDEVPVDLDRWRDLAAATLADSGVRGACELSLFFVDTGTITALNNEHMGKVGPTDVLAFPLDAVAIAEPQGPGAVTKGPVRNDPDRDEVPLLLGDVVVCPAVAREQAPGHAGTLDDELALLVVHGILHVLGHDHADADEEVAMRAAERAILERHHWKGPAPVGFRQEHEPAEGLGREPEQGEIT